MGCQDHDWEVPPSSPNITLTRFAASMPLMASCVRSMWPGVLTKTASTPAGMAASRDAGLPRSPATTCTLGPAAATSAAAGAAGSRVVARTEMEGNCVASAYTG